MLPLQLQEWCGKWVSVAENGIRPKNRTHQSKTLPNAKKNPLIMATAAQKANGSRFGGRERAPCDHRLKRLASERNPRVSRKNQDEP
jgi:hypothetical protein